MSLAGIPAHFVESQPLPLAVFKNDDVRGVANSGEAREAAWKELGLWAPSRRSLEWAYDVKSLAGMNAGQEIHDESQFKKAERARVKPL